MSALDNARATAWEVEQHLAGEEPDAVDALVATRTLRSQLLDASAEQAGLEAYVAKLEAQLGINTAKAAALTAEGRTDVLVTSATLAALVRRAVA
jgi:hypothetical protein